MKKVWIAIAVVAFIAIGLTGFFHATRNKRRHDDGISGAQMYKMYCLRCHGEQGEGLGQYPSLKTSALKLDEFVKLIKGGRGSMPAFKKTFKDNEFEPLFRHVQELK